VLEAHPLVGEVRGGLGLMAAVALEPELVARDPHAAARFGVNGGGSFVRLPA
jgi:hypothetical protein